MGKKLNQLTKEEAEQIYQRLKADEEPSKELIRYVHDELMREHHYMFQIKKGGKRHGYCTHCGNVFDLELGRTITPADRQRLSARHGEKVTCPCCGYELTKRYDGFGAKSSFVTVADCRIDEPTQALVIYLYCFYYNFRAKHCICEPYWQCFNIGYFEPHKHFCELHGWGSTHLHFDRTYLSNLYFKRKQFVDDVFSHNQESQEGCILYNLNCYKQSKMRNSCIDEYLDKHYTLFKYLCYYCDYPELFERLLKQGNIDLANSIINQVTFGFKINYNKKEPREAFGLTRPQYRAMSSLSDYRKQIYILSAQLVNANPKLCDDNIAFLTKHIFKSKHVKAMDYLLRAAGPQKIDTWIKKQNASDYYFSLDDYIDYISECKKLEYNLYDKSILLPQSLVQAHAETSAIIALRKKQKEQEALLKKRADFEKSFLPKLEKMAFSDEKLFIRPARTVEELALEGATNHNCVFSCYADKHLNGKTALFFIRYVDSPDTPFYTLEYNKGIVVQCRTFRNKGMTDEIQSFVDKWLKYIKQIKSKGKADAA